MPNWITALFEQPGAVAIIAASFAFLAGVIVNNMNQRSLEKKEERRWQHERELELEKLERQKEQAEQERLLAERERVHNIYHNCIRALNSFISQRPITHLDIKGSPYIPEAHEWLSMLLLYVGNRDEPEAEKFRSQLKTFTGNPQSESAGVLRDNIFDLALRDRVLFPDNAAAAEHGAS